MKIKKLILYIILALYLLLILKLIVFKYPSGMRFNVANANLTPFKTILIYFSGEPTWRVAMRNLLGNIVLLVPPGFLFAIIFPKLKWRMALLLGLFAGVILELLQVIFKSGILDIDDIILNFLGFVIGYLVFYLIIRIRKYF